MAFSNDSKESNRRRIIVNVQVPAPDSVTITRPTASTRLNSRFPIRIMWTDSNLSHTSWNVSYQIAAGPIVAIGTTSQKYMDWTPPAWFRASSISFIVEAV